MGDTGHAGAEGVWPSIHNISARQRTAEGEEAVGKTSRVKGAAYERYVASLFRDIGWEDAKRHLEYQSDEAEAGRDLDGTEPFAVQVKCWKSTPSISAIQQVIVDRDYPIRVAVLKRTQSKDSPSLEVAVVDLSVFMRMIQMIETLAEEAWNNGWSDSMALDPWDHLGGIVDGV